MNVWRWMGTFLILGVASIIAAHHVPVYGQEKKDEKKAEEKKTQDKKDDKKQEEKKAEKPKPPEKPAEKPQEKPTTGGGDTLEWKAFDPKGKEWYQELYTSTKQTMKVMGQEVEQKQEQTFYISWTPGEKDKDGNYSVTQKIIGVKMSIDIGGNKITYDSTADNQPTNPMSDFFNQLQKLELKLYVSPKDMKVVKVEGGEEFVKKLGQSNQAMEPLLKAILSEKALKQMAEPTLGAFPPGGSLANKSWSSKSDLDLGPIGSYVTSYEYKYDGKEKDFDKISVKASLSYTKPSKQNGLPFKIKDAQLDSKDGTGTSLFDRKAGRFASSKMTMELKGFLTVEVGGMESRVELTQTQVAEAKASDENPVKKAEPKKTK